MGSRARPLNDQAKVIDQRPKVMILVVWGVDGAALVEIIPPDMRCSAKYMCKSALSHLEVSVRAHRPKQGLKGITFHWDNTSSHMATVKIHKIKELEMHQLPHPPYSPDIAPSDFFLFGYLKHKLQGCSYDSADELFTVIAEMMEHLEKALLHRVFNEWISRLHLVMETGGEYIQT
jgi:hypothetical protein